MGRFLLALNFLVATLLAPWVCCCTFRSIAPSEDAEQVCTSCCCEQPKPSAPKPSQTTKHECPCRSQVQPAALLAKSATMILPLVGDATDITVESFSPHPMVAGVSKLTPRVHLPDDLRVRLSLLCTLRC